ncbi:ATP-dependent zinc protease [Pseudomonas typographi]|uniref:ATP-dependent zinc protease family protein n=1 Tax=Pseudomonas typographi TaxID=2715964 RepID=UPI0016862A5A|nr:ATP-dependent zinc protease [Pseudomonas typographi]MBD1586557.1 ATP-dependent zinc protease [Pseudomonas typographi]
MTHTKLPTLLGLMLLPGLGLAQGKVTFGLNEYARLDIDLEVPAKLDTGAVTASLSARDITRFKRDGQPWVRFYLAIDNAHAHPIERPLARVSRIKRRADDYDAEQGPRYTARPVVELSVCMGDRLRTLQVNLTNRSTFQYPLLIGAEGLEQFNVVVDPSLRYSAGKPTCATVAPIAE